MDSQKGHVFLLPLVEWLKWFEIHLVVIAFFLGLPFDSHSYSFFSSFPQTTGYYGKFPQGRTRAMTTSRRDLGQEAVCFSFLCFPFSTFFQQLFLN